MCVRACVRVCVCVSEKILVIFRHKKLDRNYSSMLRAVLKKVLEAALYETAALRPLTSYLTNNLSKTNKTCRRNKDELISNVRLWTPTHCTIFTTVCV